MTRNVAELVEASEVDYFRFYHGVVDNPKFHGLPPETFRVWVFCLCLGSRRMDRGTLPPIDELPFELHMWPNRGDEVNGHIEVLIARKLITRGKDGTLRLTDWELYQPEKKKSTDRVRKHRLRHADDGDDAEKVSQSSQTIDETHMKRVSRAFHSVSETPCNARETPLREREKPPTESSSGIRSSSQTQTPLSATPPTPRGGGARLESDDDEPFVPPPGTEPLASPAPDPPEIVAVMRLADELFPSGGMALAARDECLRGTSPAWVSEALRVARDAKATRWAYVRSILARFAAAGSSDSERSAAKPRASPSLLGEPLSVRKQRAREAAARWAAEDEANARAREGATHENERMVPGMG